MLLVPHVGLDAGAAAGAGVAAFSRGRVLELLVGLYGEDVGRALTATSHEESRFNPDAHNVTTREDSRGAFQVNTDTWGDVVPMGADAGASPWERFVAQAKALVVPRSAGRASVLDDAISRAKTIVQNTGAPFGEAFDLAWQYGSAVALAGAGPWNVDAIARRIEMMSDAVKAAAWRARNAAIRAAWLTFLSVAIPVAAAGLGELALLALLLYVLFGSKEKRERTTRYAAAGAKALL